MGLSTPPDHADTAESLWRLLRAAKHDQQTTLPATYNPAMEEGSQVVIFWVQCNGIYISCFSPLGVTMTPARQNLRLSLTLSLLN